MVCTSAVADACMHAVHPLMQVYIDLKEVAAGSLKEDWDMLPPKTIKVCACAALGWTHHLQR